MEILFTASIIFEGQNKLYTVFFREERYHFEPEDGNGTTFSIARENDAWHINGALPDIAGDQAISALDHYLLSQH